MAGATFLSKYRKFGTVRRVSLSWWTGRRDSSSKILFRRAVHVQSFQSPCTCTARRALPADFIPFHRANQDLQNAFLDESLAQKEAKIWPLKVLTFFAWFSHQLSLIWAYKKLQNTKMVCSSWLALSNEMKSEGSAGRARSARARRLKTLHVRRATKKDFQAGVPVDSCYTPKTVPGCKKSKKLL